MLSEGLAPHSQQQRHFGMIRSADTLEFGLWLTGSGGSPQRGFGSCCCPIQTAWQLGAFPQQNCPRGTCSSPPRTPPHPAQSCLQPRPTADRAPLLGTPSPRKGLPWLRSLWLGRGAAKPDPDLTELASKFQKTSCVQPLPKGACASQQHWAISTWSATTWQIYF